MSFRQRLLYPALLLASSFADAATIVVDNLEDDGPGSLRAAIAQANDDQGPDTITFRDGLAGTIVQSGGELLVRGDLGILGPGTTRLTIELGQRSRAFRFENPEGAAANWRLEGITVSHGLSDAATGDDGGALYARGDAGVSPKSTLSLTGMAFVDGGAVRYGGGIAASGIDLVLDRVSLTGNRAGHGGGGLYFAGGSLRVERSDVADNFVGGLVAGRGGGLLLLGTDTRASILDSTIRANTATEEGGGGFFSVLTLSIHRSSFIGNTADDGGGGVSLSTGTANAPGQGYVIENSTFSGNRTPNPSASGSAIAALLGRLTVHNSTIAFNQVSPDDEPAPDTGGALWVAYGVTHAIVQSTLFAANTSGASGPPSDLARMRSPDGVLLVEHSLLGVLPPIGVITHAEANIEADARLQELTYEHGGFAPVHPLAGDSPAVDRGSNPAELATDQRGNGFARRWSPPNATDGVPDIGAYEYRADAFFVGDFESLGTR